MNDIDELLERWESEKIEFKEEFSPRIYKEIIAFANSDGGCVFVGINDQGDAVGLKDVDDQLTRITNGIRDNISPDISLCIHYKLYDPGVILIDVKEGTHKPYFLTSKGMTPSGVFVRQGSSSAPASNEAIEKMISERSLLSFESMRPANQELTFSQAQQVFEEKGITLDESKFVNLGLKDLITGEFTNTAYLISDQNPYKVKAAVFKNLLKTEFASSREFTGSVLKQVSDVIEYFNERNDIRTLITGSPSNTKIFNYPPAAIREAIINAIVHRDYSYVGDTIINMTEECIEVLSVGGLPSTLSYRQMMSGYSVPRNPKLADVFHRLQFIEAFGTGIRRIFLSYGESSKKPEIELFDNGFKIILPNVNYSAKDNSSDVKLNPQMQKLYDYLKSNSRISLADTESLLGVKTARVYALTNEMIGMGLIESEGRGKNKYYSLSKPKKDS